MGIVQDRVGISDLKGASDGSSIGAMEKSAGSVFQYERGVLRDGLSFGDPFEADNDVSDATCSLIHYQRFIWDCHATNGAVPVNRERFGFWDCTSDRDPAIDCGADSAGIYFIRISNLHCAEYTPGQQEEARG